MRIVLSAGVAIVAAATLTAAPSQAQSGSFMWCQATADNGAESTTYYSAFFSAAAYQAETKAKAFKSEIEDEEISAATVTANCTVSADYDAAVASRNAAMKAAPGKVVGWEG